ncbi:hypothetical protein K1719_011315 [Acacia pycnantha]|nr:hypothetical protein K1719_011315 [Acacia pycnantha]
MICVFCSLDSALLRRRRFTCLRRLAGLCACSKAFKALSAKNREKGSGLDVTINRGVLWATTRQNKESNIDNPYIQEVVSRMIPPEGKAEVECVADSPKRHMIATGRIRPSILNKEEEKQSRSSIWPWFNLLCVEEDG